MAEFEEGKRKKKKGVAEFEEEKRKLKKRR